MKFDSNRNSKSLLAAWIFVAAFFALFIVFPLFCALISASPADFAAVFTQSVWHEAMKNTLAECLSSTTLSVVIGYIFAYAIARGNIPFKRFFSVVPVLHLILWFLPVMLVVSQGFWMLENFALGFFHPTESLFWRCPTLD